MSDSNKDKLLSVDEYLSSNDCSEVELRQKMLNKEIYALAWVDGLHVFISKPSYKVSLATPFIDRETLYGHGRYKKVAGFIYPDTSTTLKALSAATPLLEKIYVTNSMSHTDLYTDTYVGNRKPSYRTCLNVFDLRRDIKKGELSRIDYGLFFAVTGGHFPQREDRFDGEGDPTDVDFDMYRELSEEFYLKLEGCKHEAASTLEWVVQPCNQLEVKGTIGSYLHSQGINLEALTCAERDGRGTHAGLRNEIDQRILSRPIVEEEEFLIERKDLYIVNNIEALLELTDKDIENDDNNESDEDQSEKDGYRKMIIAAEEVQLAHWSDYNPSAPDTAPDKGVVENFIKEKWPIYNKSQINNIAEIARCGRAAQRGPKTGK